MISVAYSPCESSVRTPVPDYGPITYERIPLRPAENGTHSMYENGYFAGLRVPLLLSFQNGPNQRLVIRVRLVVDASGSCAFPVSTDVRTRWKTKSDFATSSWILSRSWWLPTTALTLNLDSRIRALSALRTSATISNAAAFGCLSNFERTVPPM